MKALTFEYSIPRYLLTGALSRKWPSILFTEWAPVQVRDVPEPVLPGDDWVKVRPRLAGLCGSDLSMIRCRESLTLQPFASFPFVLGHEVCGEIAEMGSAVEGFRVGERVAVMPILSCRERGIDPPCRPCSQGRLQLCENFTKGRFSPGMFAGSNADVPGSISEMTMAPFYDLIKIPEKLRDEDVVMVEPLATCLHMVIANDIQPGETLLVFGCGVMGLCTLAALRALHPHCRLIAVEPDSFHAQLAMDLGAEKVIPPGGKAFYREIAELTGAKMYTPIMTKPLLIGGPDRVFDTVGSTETVESSLRILANGGTYNLLGISPVKRIDWTPVWLKELTLRGIYGSQMEHWRGRDITDFEIAIQLMEQGEVKLGHLVTHRFSLNQYHKALEVALNKGRYHAVKIAFTPTSCL